ncbi:hypothetical protein T07_14903 [Trichinella nelsoni]|uniref:Uncharacterized protein n=1 Tax=Trichinella nelsoni TaxID=6336 RepID=A0A0V0RWW4_9BILA|nr:hypothetical protein T07_14903 [Trichinella nelsoni]
MMELKAEKTEIAKAKKLKLFVFEHLCKLVERLKYVFPSFTSTPMKNTRNGRVQVRQHTSVGCALTDETTKGTGWLRMYSKFPVNKSQQNTLPSSEPLIICLSEERKQLSILYSLFLWPVNLQ